MTKFLLIRHSRGRAPWTVHCSQTAQLSSMTAIGTLFLLFFSSLSLAVPSTHASLRNVSLQWIDGFTPQLTWTSLKNCTYAVSELNKSRRQYNYVTSPWQEYIVMNGGFLSLSVTALCNNNRSNSEIVTVTYPDLVRNDWHCYTYSANRSRCSWFPASLASDVRFFYRLLIEDNSQPPNQTTPLSPRECPSYIYTDGIRTGCDLEAKVTHRIDILFNGTVNNTFARNTFQTLFDMRPNPFNWTVTKAGEKFLISWPPLDVPCDWSYVITYTECTEPKKHKSTKQTSLELFLVPHCQYDMSIKATCKKATVLGIDEKHFDADTNPDAWLLAAIFIPLILGFLAALMFVCYRNNKEHIFPKVPVPRDLISDIYDNNKSTLLRMYVPSVEEENVKITLVIDPLINKLN